MKRVVSKMPNSTRMPSLGKLCISVSAGYVCPITGERKIYRDQRVKDIAFRHHQKRCEHCATIKLDPPATKEEQLETHKRFKREGKTFEYTMRDK